MYSAHKIGQVNSFWGSLRSKIYGKIIANDSKSYLSYLNKLVDEYNNNYIMILRMQ